MPSTVVYHCDFDGNRIAEFPNPPGLKWMYQLGAKGAGGIEYTIAESDPNLLFEDFGPLRTDWLLEVDGIPVDAGFITSVNTPLSSDAVNVTGKNWLQWLEQPWRGSFNYVDDIDTIIANRDPTQFQAIFNVGSTVQDIIVALLDPLSSDPATQVILNPVYSGSSFGEELVGSIERANSTTVQSLLSELAAMGKPYGFDYWTDYMKWLHMVGPRRTDPGSIGPIASFFDASTIIDGDWTNNGPNGTDILYTDGSGNTSRYKHFTHAPSVAKYRKWGFDRALSIAPGGFNMMDTSQFEFRVEAAGYRDLFPQKELTLTVRPETIGYAPVLMAPVEVDYRKGYVTGGYWRIDAFFWITSQTYRQLADGSGDWVCDLTLDQIYIPIS